MNDNPTKLYGALHIANYLISLANPEEEDFITNLKLQKLLYYAQGFHLALFNKPLGSTLEEVHNIINLLESNYPGYTLT
jgi:uncharacterized phage-associated protein